MSGYSMYGNPYTKAVDMLNFGILTLHNILKL